MMNSFFQIVRGSAIRLTAVTFLGLLLSAVSFAQSINSTMPFFSGALLVQAKGPQTLSAGPGANNTFSLLVTDADGTPYPAITKQWVRASVEMTNMDMGITPVNKIEDVLDKNKQFQGLIQLNPIFSMRGPWKLSITITVSGEDGKPMEDTQTLTFDVNK
jgi:hypothetical protein